MKTQNITLKHVNMLCHKCVMNVIRTLSQIQGIKEMDVDLDTNYIRLKYINPKYTKNMIKKMIKDAIEGTNSTRINSYLLVAKVPVPKN